MRATMFKSEWSGESIEVVELCPELPAIESFDMHDAMSIDALELRNELLQRQIHQQTEGLEKLLAEAEDLLLALRRKRAGEEETKATSTDSAA